ncbi:MAG: COQ9 family protein [Pseudomonadota bacterium]
MTKGAKAKKTAPDQPADPVADARVKLVEAAVPNVVFDGWSSETLERAIEDTGIDRQLAAMAFPRGGVDMALAFHALMDERLKEDLAGRDLSTMKIRERVTFCVRRRLELIDDERDAVRRGATLLSLPIYARDSAAAIWSTADIIWTACGDTADDYNWYTKRAILSSVYSATLLYWLGDTSEGSANTWAFLDRRIENVMQVERMKAAVNANPLTRMAFAPLNRALSMVRPPHARSRSWTGAQEPGVSGAGGGQPAEG